MPSTPENQFTPATTEQVRGWMAHDAELIQDGAEIVNGYLTLSREQHERMRQEMASKIAGQSAIENVVLIEPPHLIQGAGESLMNARRERVKLAAAEALNRIMKPGLGAQPEEIGKAFGSKKILPEGTDGEIASQVAGMFSEGSRNKITPDQMKWFALGLAAQATATNNFNDSNRSEV